ncbi:phage tail protein [Inquilinus sp. OTU3971]|uniref:phage tail protein n=1 Tax=Inquilinus sp. OTU3971 TaxID=3043855 RepID=UPI00313BCFFB
MESYLATVMGWAPNFAPRGWAFCGGQILAISQNTALFSLLGTTYGGNGQTTFQLPNLFGRTPIGAGQGGGLPSYELGQVGGTPSTTLTTNNLPAHVHDGSTLTALEKVATTAANTAQTVATDTSILGAPNFLDSSSGSTIDVNTFANNTANPSVNIKLAVSGTTGPTGGTQPFSIMPPYLAINWIIALEGIFPPRS